MCMIWTFIAIAGTRTLRSEHHVGTLAQTFPGAELFYMTVVILSC